MADKLILICFFIFFIFFLTYHVPAFAEDEPVIIYSFRSDPKSSPVTGLDSDDVINIVFSPATNEPLKSATNNQLTKTDVDSIFAFSTPIGTDYEGRWIDPFVIEIIIVDPGTVISSDLSSLTFTVKASADLKNAELTSSASTTDSGLAFFLGSFDSRSDPFITSFVANDPDDGDSIYSNGDTFTIRYNEATNEPLKGSSNSLTKSDVDQLFGFGQDGDVAILGLDYGGTWLDPATFLITIADITGSTPPKLGSMNVTSVGTFFGTPVKNADETSTGLETSVYANVTGSFASFTETKLVAPGGKLFTAKADGTYQLFSHDSSLFESITVISTDASTDVDGGVGTFVGDVVDIKGSATTCTSQCTISYKINQVDLDRFGVSADDLKILHDRNDDGDFNDDGEALDTLISSGLSLNSFNVTSSDDRISKFAVGGVVGSTGATANAVAGINALGSFWDFIDTCDEDGFGNGKSLQIYEIFYDKCVENKISLLADSSCGPISLKIATPYGISLVGMGQDQPYLNNETRKLSFEHSINEDTEWFTIIAKDKRDEFTERIFANQCSGIKNYLGSSGYTSEQQGAFTVVDELDSVEPLSEIPEWIKNNAKWWAEDQLDDATFIEGLEYMIQEQIFSISDINSVSEPESSEIPEWIKNNAKWWAEDQLDDATFIEALQFLIQNRILILDDVSYD